METEKKTVPRKSQRAKMLDTVKRNSLEGICDAFNKAHKKSDKCFVEIKDKQTAAFTASMAWVDRESDDDRVVVSLCIGGMDNARFEVDAVTFPEPEMLRTYDKDAAVNDEIRTEYLPDSIQDIDENENVKADASGDVDEILSGFLKDPIAAMGFELGTALMANSNKQLEYLGEIVKELRSVSKKLCEIAG